MWKNVYLINLEKRQDRLEMSSKILSNININFTRFNAISPIISQLENNELWYNAYKDFCRRDRRRRKLKYTIGALGCKMSHYYILKKAKELNIDYVIILEDDIKLNPNYLKNRDVIDKHILELINNKNQWDIIYIGGTPLKYGGNRKLKDKYNELIDKDSFCRYGTREYSRLHRVNNYYVKVDAVNTTLGYIINKNNYNKLISEIPKCGFEIDRYYNQNLLNHKVYKIEPEIFYQNGLDSDICNKL